MRKKEQAREQARHARAFSPPSKYRTIRPSRDHVAPPNFPYSMPHIKLLDAKRPTLRTTRFEGKAATTYASLATSAMNKTQGFSSFQARHSSV